VHPPDGSYVRSYRDVRRKRGADRWKAERLHHDELNLQPHPLPPKERERERDGSELKQMKFIRAHYMYLYRSLSKWVEAHHSFERILSEQLLNH